jgi:hypothetical protein
MFVIQQYIPKSELMRRTAPYFHYFIRVLFYIRMKEFVRLYVTEGADVRFYVVYISPFCRFLGDVRRELMQNLSVVFHGALGLYLRYALQEGGIVVVAYLRRGLRLLCLPLILLWCW